MKIIFLCGSLEPGRDGVGDYSRRLAGELIRQGHQAAAAALNDRQISVEYEGTQETDNTILPVLRIPSLWSAKQRFSRTREWIDRMDPEWLSLQFVPYSFQPKGMPFELFQYLSSFKQKYRWHIMFHELYVEPSDLKNGLVSTLQSIIIYSLVKALKPILINTHLPVYKERLLKLGIMATPLPLFSNIPNVISSIDKEENFFTIAFFSQFRIREAVILFLKNISKEIFLKGLELKILLIGGNSNTMIELRDALASIEDLKQKISHTGKLSETELSKIIQKCNLGVSPVPRHLIGKSGSVAAFLAHGVPVAAPFVKPGFRDLDIGFFNERLRSAVVTDPAFCNFQKAVEVVITVRHQVQASEVSKAFISQLEKNNSSSR